MSVRPVLSRRWYSALAALLALGAGARADEEVHVTVVCVLATNKNDTVDERVKCIADQMKKIDPKLTGFSVARVTSKDVPVGKKDCFEAVDGQDVCVTVEGRCDKDKNRFRLKVEGPKLGPLTYMTCCTKFFPVVTRYKTKGGELLIVAVSVKDRNDE